jgi:hypothetical protein
MLDELRVELGRDKMVWNAGWSEELSDSWTEQKTEDGPEAMEEGLIDRLSLGSEVGWRSFGAATAAPLLSLGAGEEAYGLTPAIFGDV